MQEAQKVPFSVAACPFENISPPRTLAVDRLPPNLGTWPSKEQLRICRTGLQHGSLETAAYLVCLCRPRGGIFPRHVPKYLLYQAFDVWDYFPRQSLPFHNGGPRNRSERTCVWHCPMLFWPRAPARAVPAARNILLRPRFPLP